MVTQTTASRIRNFWTPMLDCHSLVRRLSTAIDAPIHGEIFVSQIETDTFYSLAGTGKEIWELLATPVTVGELCGRMSEAHGLAQSAIEEDVHLFLANLVEAKLIRIEG